MLSAHERVVDEKEKETLQTVCIFRARGGFVATTDYRRVDDYLNKADYVQKMEKQTVITCAFPTGAPTVYLVE